MRPVIALAVLALASGCAGRSEPPAPASAPPAVAPVAEAATPTPAEVLPIRGDGPPLPAASTILTRIAFGSCAEETLPIPIMGALATLAPDLFVWVGDNVYGDAEAGDMALPELKQAYADMAMNAFFSAFTMGTPMLAVWDDHDYGLNDAGGDFAGKARAERLFETFWRESSLGDERPGAYGARIFGPPGRRVQVILLDTRFFRSPLRRSDVPNAQGYRPYLPDTDPSKTMLGEAQWSWLAQELRKPAEIRLVVSSVQVLSDGHPVEGWRTLPLERARLLRTLDESGAGGVVLVSGDRHFGALYRRTGRGPPLHELTASSLNKPVPATQEQAPGQIGATYAQENFGLVEIDWERRQLTLSLRGMDGAAERALPLRFADVGVRSD